ncbi:hypothetical protein [Deinococcus aetherius]|nr:hypothetical protein [Deinococcus aetherius]
MTTRQQTVHAIHLLERGERVQEVCRRTGLNPVQVGVIAQEVGLRLRP